ncbi:unnamed protein product, partial [marine sediment metagenome]
SFNCIEVPLIVGYKLNRINIAIGIEICLFELYKEQFKLSNNEEGIYTNVNYRKLEIYRRFYPLLKFEYRIYGFNTISWYGFSSIEMRDLDLYDLSIGVKFYLF